MSNTDTYYAEIKAAFTVRDILDGHGVQVRGKQFRCIHPRHDDTNPSASLYDDDTRWKCFSCGAGGDVVDAYALLNGCDTQEAAELLAQQAGIPTWTERIEEQRKDRPVVKPKKAKSDKRAKTSAENGKQGGRPPAPPHADVAALYASSIRDEDGRLPLRHYRGEWWLFGASGWINVDYEHVESRIALFLKTAEVVTPRGTIQLRPYSTTNYVRSVALNLRTPDLCGITGLDMPCWLDTGESARNWMAFSNGIAVNVLAYAQAIANGSEPGPECVRPVSSALFSTDFVSYDWQPDMIPIRFFAYLERVQPELDGFNAVRRMMGLLLADITNYEVFFQLYGNGANGKTVLLDIIRAIVGPHACSYVALMGLVTRFKSWPLAHSKVNICGELPTDYGSSSFHEMEGAFKDAISGGNIDYEKKNQNMTIAAGMPCRARFVVSANQLPTFVDRSDAIWRRLRIIPFPVQIPEGERDAELADTIIREEMPGIVAWAIDGLSEILRNRCVPDTKAGQEFKQSHRMSCDHERMFLTEKYQEGDEDDKVRASDVYDDYRDWVVSNGYRALGSAKFKARVLDIFPNVSHLTIRIGDEVTKGYSFLRKLSAVEQF